MAGNTKFDGTINRGTPATPVMQNVIQRQASIQPQGNVGGIQDAFNNAAEAHEASLAYAKNIGHNLAIENAANQGAKSARENPGVEPIPAFTAGDKTFVDAYRQEEVNNITFKGQTFLNNAAAAVQEDPTPQNLMDYQNASQQTIGRLLEQTTEHNRANIERSLQGAYQGQFLKLSSQVEAKNKQVLSQNYAASTASNLEQVYNLEVQGLGEQASSIVNAQRQSTDSAINTESTTPEQARKTIEQFEDAKAIGSWVKRVNDARANGGDEAVNTLLEDFAKNPPENLTPLQYEKVGSNLLSYVNQQNALQRQAEQFRLANVNYQINSKQITNFDQLQEAGADLSAYDYLQASETLLRANKGSGVFDQIQTAMQRNDGSIDNFNNTELESAYNKMLTDALVLQGNPKGVPTFDDKTQVIGQMNAPVDAYFNETNFSLKSGDPQRMAEVMQGLQYLSDNAPNALNFKDSQARAIFEVADNLSRYSGIPLPEASKRAYEQVTKPTLDIQQRAENWSKEVEIKRNADGSTRENQLAAAYQDIFDVPPTDVGQDAAFFEFSKLMESHYLQYPDFDVAKIATKRDMEKAWGESKWASDADETMFLPPEKAIKMSQVGNWFDNQIGLALQAVADNNKSAVENGILHKANVEISEGKRLDLKSVDQNSLFSRPHGPGTSAIIDGKERPVFLKTDGRSRFGKGTPTYFLYYHDEFGFEQPVSDPYNPSGFAQFSPVSMAQFVPQVYDELQKKDVNSIARKYAGALYDKQNPSDIFSHPAPGSAGISTTILKYIGNKAKKEQFIREQLPETQQKLEQRLEGE